MRGFACPKRVHSAGRYPARDRSVKTTSNDELIILTAKG